MPEANGRVCVFAPAPLLTVTVESPRGAATGDIHLHPGGQGFWVARLLAELDIRVVLCGSFGGETGHVVRALMVAQGMTVRSVSAAGSNGAYLHDRRSGQRSEIAMMPADALTRHEVDELYGAVLVEGLDADVCVLGGPSPGDDAILPADTYRRLAVDLRANGTQVVADLSGEILDAVLEAGVTLLKVSHEELIRDGRVERDGASSLVRAMRHLIDSGAEHVIVTRAEAPALTMLNGAPHEVVSPRLEALESRGAGDSLTAGIAAEMARGASFETALRTGAAAGALNVTRRGLATGRRDEIQQLAKHVKVRPLRLHPSEVA